MGRRRLPRPKGYHWDQKEMVVRADGLRACRWCKGPVRPPRRTFCGDPDCLEQWTMRTDPRMLRAVLFRRDLGVCALCGLDTKPLDLPLLREQTRLADRWAYAGPHRRAELERLILKGEDGRVWPPAYWAGFLAPAVAWHVAQRVPVDETPWQADHITPLARGGEAFDLGNLRTLCVPCHRRITAEFNVQLAAERKARRRAERARTRGTAQLRPPPGRRSA